ncbi:hypothetical protein B0T26DRAFT_646884 [Lasiosphaeria miniovina]|uniref:Uncharacterized protein n=1 Tax=Lasiosphaeria miniovina TaxID=1954250 RepID=A0AA40AKN4_9PEZI|nr:uncharacterized protein B0T26DRAFT_646884 [Lasiosphaeria miniovina]KAK0717609.1 hypothetical protein B0T26DRAFT_646884 [Lasiosphaeria miniovina]
MGSRIGKAGALLLAVLATLGLGQDRGDGYYGYRLEQRGDPESTTYETADTVPGVPLPKQPDVYLNANVSVGEISIEVDNITAKVNLDAQVLKLLHFTAGVDASIDRVRLLIQNVSAKVELEARLGNVVAMVDNVLHSIDLNPILATLGQDVSKIVNSTLNTLGGPVNGSSGSGSANAKRSEPSFSLEHNVLYSVNDYTGKTHTNRRLAQNGTIFDEFLDNDGTEHGRAVVGYYARDMVFNGHNKTIAVDGHVSEFELQYEYKPFPGIDVTCWIYLDPAGKVTRTQVIAEAQGGGTSTISNDSEL